MQGMQAVGTFCKPKQMLHIISSGISSASNPFGFYSEIFY